MARLSCDGIKDDNLDSRIGLVAAWDYKFNTMAVLCPWCWHLEDHDIKVHKHLSCGSQPDTRQALCELGTDYGLRFTVVWVWENPFANVLDYEYNIVKQRMQVVGYPIHEFDLEDHLDCRNPESQGWDSQDDIVPKPPSEDSDNFGNTALALAAASGDVDIVEAQLLSGTDIDARNEDGFTPLMHAAFLGRLAVAIVLIKFGPSFELKDRYGRTARALTEDNPILDAERRQSMFWSGDDNLKQRQQINILLTKPNVFPQSFQDRSVKDATRLQTFHCAKDSTSKTSPSGTIHLLAPVECFETVNVLNKTLGILHRGTPFSPIFAVSGWCDSTKGPSKLLHNRLWTRRVFDMCKMINHTLPPHGRDKSWEPGTYNASHVEKQLMVFCVTKHPPEENRQVSQVIIQLDKRPTFKDKGPCRDCREFQNKLEKAFGIKFKIEVIPQTAYRRNLVETTPAKTPTRQSARIGSKGLITPPGSQELTVVTPSKRRIFRENDKDEQEEEDETAEDMQDSSYEIDEMDELGMPESPCSRITRHRKKKQRLVTRLEAIKAASMHLSVLTSASKQYIDLTGDDD